METIYSGHNDAVVNAQTTDEGWVQETSVILDLSTLFCIHKSTGEVLGPIEILILIQKSLFSSQKPQMRAGTHIDLQLWC